MVGVEEALGFGEVVIDFLEGGTEFVGDFGRECGNAGDRDVDAFEEAGFEAGVVAVGLIEFGAVAVVADVGAASAAAAGAASCLTSGCAVGRDLRDRVARRRRR